MTHLTAEEFVNGLGTWDLEETYVIDILPASKPTDEPLESPPGGLEPVGERPLV